MAAKQAKVININDKEKRINAEIERLTNLYQEFSLSTKQVVKTLIKNAAFMAVTLEDLQDAINQNGVVSEYKNGENQWGTKESPEVKIHIAMTKNYNHTLKQLTDLLPKDTPKEKGDGFDDFVADRSD